MQLNHCESLPLIHIAFSFRHQVNINIAPSAEILSSSAFLQKSPQKANRLIDCAPFTNRCEFTELLSA